MQLELADGVRLAGVVGEPGELVPARRGRLEVELDGYGYRWLRVVGDRS